MLYKFQLLTIDFNSILLLLLLFLVLNQIVFPQQQKSFNNIREVDFKNFHFVYDHSNYIQEFYTTNGFITDSSYFFEDSIWENGDYYIEKIVFGNFDQDSLEEAVITFFRWTYGTTGRFTDGLVYKLVDGFPKAVDYLEGGDRCISGISDVKVLNGLLYVSNYSDLGYGLMGDCNFEITKEYKLSETGLVRLSCQSSYVILDYAMLKERINNAKKLISFDFSSDSLTYTDSIQYSKIYVLELWEGQVINLSSLINEEGFYILSNADGFVFNDCDNFYSEEVTFLINKSGVYFLEIINFNWNAKRISTRITIK